VSYHCVGSSNLAVRSSEIDAVNSDLFYFFISNTLVLGRFVHESSKYPFLNLFDNSIAYCSTYMALSYCGEQEEAESGLRGKKLHFCYRRDVHAPGFRLDRHRGDTSSLICSDDVIL